MTGLKLSDVLKDPQSINSYSYARNNPITLSDPQGKWFSEFLTGQQSWSNFTGEVGQATIKMTQDNPNWNYAVSNPYTAGALIGVLVAPAAEAGVSAILAANAATTAGVGTAYIAKQATAAVFYSIVTAGGLQSIPETIGILGKQNTTNQNKYTSTIFNIGVQIGPTIAGGHIGAISDAMQFVQTIGKKLTKQLTSSNQSSTNSSSKKNYQNNKRN